jgi:hypothetical protein
MSELKFATKALAKLQFQEKQKARVPMKHESLEKIQERWVKEKAVQEYKEQQAQLQAKIANEPKHGAKLDQVPGGVHFVASFPEQWQNEASFICSLVKDFNIKNLFVFSVFFKRLIDAENNCLKINKFRKNNGLAFEILRESEKDLYQIYVENDCVYTNIDIDYGLWE